jgi:uncharacterized protein YdeI (YjbR/CyaY-like superfamily)
MKTKDLKVDEYIKGSPFYAQPILKHLREIIHETCPDIVEKIHYGCPTFEYQGQLVCSIISYTKPHCSLNFWKSSLLKDPDKVLAFRVNKDAGEIGILGKITSIKDLPEDKIIAGFIKQVIKLNEDGIIPTAPVKRTALKFMEVPDYFQKALDNNADAKKNFAAFSQAQRNAYYRWFETFKDLVLRSEKVAIAINWIAEGKAKDWNAGNETRGRKKAPKV